VNGNRSKVTVTVMKREKKGRYRNMWSRKREERNKIWQRRKKRVKK
jgi:hypothetical protein